MPKQGQRVHGVCVCGGEELDAGLDGVVEYAAVNADAPAPDPAGEAGDPGIQPGDLGFDAEDTDLWQWRCLTEADCQGRVVVRSCEKAGCRVEDGVCVAVPDPAQDGLGCDDGNACTLGDLCQGGACLGQAKDCDDHNPCTDDFCDPVTDCTHLFHARVCSVARCEGASFYPASFCSQGACPSQVPVECDDHNPCTDDSCDLATGCVHTVNTLPCDDGNACTDDSCDPAAGCVFTANTLPCDDGNACTGADTCKAGKCTGMGIDCDDGNPCTDDSCDPAMGCVFDANPEGMPCDDGNACTELETCKAGKCTGMGIDCDDGNPCTMDLCNPAMGCVYMPLASGVTCGTGKVCKSMICTAATCPSGFVLIPSGTFTMGSPMDEPGRDSDEVQHQVWISRAFCLKQTEVTQGEWQSAMGNNPSNFSSCGGTRPVEQVSWWDAVAYCNTLSANESLTPCYTLTGCSGTPGAGNYTCTGVTFAGLGCPGYRLPTESEWEYAARADTTGGTYNGTSTFLFCEQPNGVLDPIAWFCGNSIWTTRPVKGKQANAWDLHDMLGNVWEWCWDLFGQYPGAVTDPTGATTGSHRVVRGGGWYDSAGYVRNAYRNNNSPGNRKSYLGFRPARSMVF